MLVLTMSQVPDGHTFDEVRMAAEKLPLRTAEERAKLQKEQEGSLHLLCLIVYD